MHYTSGGEVFCYGRFKSSFSSPKAISELIFAVEHVKIVVHVLLPEILTRSISVLPDRRLHRQGIFSLRGFENPTLIHRVCYSLRASMLSSIGGGSFDPTLISIARSIQTRHNKKSTLHNRTDYA